MEKEVKMEQAGRRAIAVDSEKITTEHEQANLIHKQSHEEWEAMDAHWDRFYMDKQPLASPSMEEEEGEEEEVEYENDWSLEKYPKMGWKLCLDCLDGNFCKSPESVLKGAGQAIGVNGSEKITKQDELTKLVKEASENMDDAEFYAYWVSLYQKRPLPPPSIEEWDSAWSLEEFARRGWKLCPDCLRGNFYERPERVVKGAGQAIVVDGSEKIVSDDELAKMIWDAREYMDDKEFYPYLDSLHGRQPLAPEECDNASSPDEQLVRTICYRKPTRLVKDGRQAIVVNGSEKIVSDDELAKMIWDAREYMDDKEFYPYLDSLYGRQPLFPEECDNASSPDEQLVRTVGLAINTSSRRKKKKNKRKKETPSLWTLKLFKRGITKMRSK